MLRSITRTLLSTAFVVAAVAPLGAQQAPSPPYKRDLPAQLLAKATVKEADAARVARARFPKAHIRAVELEDEGGRLIYSYELKTTGKSGIDEVNVSAKTGKLVNTEHEGAKTEAREEAHEKRPRRPNVPPNR